MQRTIDPFLYARREHESANIIYLTDEPQYREWVSRQQCFFVGLRGSGKTSILRSMEWDVVWHTSDITIEGSAGIKRLFAGPPEHLAVRCKMEEMDKRCWSSWEKQVGTELAQLYFGTYLEYVLLDLFLNAILRIMQQRVPEFPVKAESEQRLLEDLMQTAFPGDSGYRPNLAEKSLWGLRSAIRAQHLGLRQLVYSKRSDEALHESFPVLSPGELVQCFARSLTSNYEELSDLKVFPMLDDCNQLTDWQAQVVNKAISKAEMPVAYKITSVQGLYASRRTTDDRQVGEQEIRTIALSPAEQGKWGPYRQFAQMVQGVCWTKIASVYGLEIAHQFNFKRLLGDFDLEDALVKALSRSEKTQATLLLEEARKEAETSGKSVSVTATWLRMRRIREKEKPSVDNEEVRKKLLRQSYSSYFKKWNHVAAVAICRDPELRLSFPYCGWRTVLHLCSGSFREILYIMSAIWSEVNVPIDRFVALRDVDHYRQMKAIKRAASRHLEALDDKPLFEHRGEPERSHKSATGISATSLPSICQRLGKLFAQFQSYPAVCVSAESASLKVSKRDLPDEILGAIDFAVMTGALLKSEDDTTLAVGLHPFYSPLFDTSFRYPFYYPQSVDTRDFIALFKGDNKQAEEASSRILTERLTRSLRGNKARQSVGQRERQMDLFDDLE